MVFAWCAVPDGEDGGEDGELTKFFIHKGSFTESDFLNYFIRLASGQMVVLPGAEFSHCGHVQVSWMERKMQVNHLWQCFACNRYKANNLFTYRLLPIVYMYIYVFKENAIPVRVFVVETCILATQEHVFLFYENTYALVQQEHLLFLSNSICNV